MFKYVFKIVGEFASSHIPHFIQYILQPQVVGIVSEFKSGIVAMW